MLYENVIKQIRRHDFTKELKEIEYETKFDIQSETDDCFTVLKKIRECFRDAREFLLCKIRNGDALSTHVVFFTENALEYSLFLYRGAKMIKIKRHGIVKNTAFTVFKNHEELVIDKSDFVRKLSKQRCRFRRHTYRLVDVFRYWNNTGSPTRKYAGVMEKKRAKDFVLDTHDGRIYAIAVTFCRSGNKIQKQLEIEYAGFLPRFGKRRKNSEVEIVAGIEEISLLLFNSLPALLVPSHERKLEFVKKAGRQK